jgi:hypothetical protein
VKPARWLVVGAALCGFVGGLMSAVDLRLETGRGVLAVLPLAAGGLGACFGGIRHHLYEQAPLVGGLLSLFTLAVLSAFVRVRHLTVWSLALLSMVGLYMGPGW